MRGELARSAAEPVFIGLCAASAVSSLEPRRGLLIRGSQVRILPGASKPFLRIPDSIFARVPTPATLVWLHGVVTSADVDQNLADGAVLDGIVRVRSALERKAVEWKPDVLSDFERAVFDRRGDVGNSLIFRRGGHGVHEDELVAKVAGHQFTHVQFELGAPSVA